MLQPCKRAESGEEDDDDDEDEEEEEEEPPPAKVEETPRTPRTYVV